jgi:hypothetical protein
MKMPGFSGWKENSQAEAGFYLLCSPHHSNATVLVLNGVVI